MVAVDVCMVGANSNSNRPMRSLANFDIHHSIWKQSTLNIQYFVAPDRRIVKIESFDFFFLLVFEYLSGYLMPDFPFVFRQKILN